MKERIISIKEIKKIKKIKKTRDKKIRGIWK